MAAAVEANASGGDELRGVVRSQADEETVQRHRRLLSEQVYLLRNKVGNGIGFLRPKLVKNLDNQLKALVNARLKSDFDALHKYLDEKERQLATMIFGWSKKFYPQIDANVDFIERELQKDRDLIRKGELALGRSNAFLLESRNVAKLLEHLQAAVRRDNLAKIRELESYTNLSEYSFRTDGVKRAIDRVFIAPPPQEEGKRIMARMAFAVSADAPTKSLNPSLLDYAAVNRLCWRKVSTLWDRKFPDRSFMESEQEFTAFLKAIVEDLMDTKHPVPEEFVIELFQNYEVVSNLPELRYDVQDVVSTLFEDLFTDFDAFADKIRQRMDPIKSAKFVMHRGLFTSTWALFIEKSIETAILRHTLQKQPVVYVGVPPPKNAAAAADAAAPKDFDDEGTGDVVEADGIF